MRFDPVPESHICWVAGQTPQCFRSDEGVVYYVSEGRLYEVGLPQETNLPVPVKEVVRIPEIMKDDLIATTSGMSSVWVAGMKGPGNYRLDADGGCDGIA